MATTKDTRQRIVEAARDLFWEKGYTATGLAELLQRANANSGSFYHFFESKDAVLRTVLETYEDLLDPHIIQPAFDRHADPIKRIFHLLDSYRQRLVATKCQYACPIGRLALEIDPTFCSFNAASPRMATELRHDMVAAGLIDRCIGRRRLREAYWPR